MDHRSAIRLIEEIELRLAFLGVGLDEAIAEASGRSAGTSARTGGRKSRRDGHDSPARIRRH
jgi:hypothetical protein